MNKLMLEKNENLPSDWILTNLETVGIITTGNTPPKKNPENYGNYLSWVKPPQLRQDVIIIDTPEKLSEQGSKHARIVEKNSILVSCIGHYLGKVGIAGTALTTNQQINSISFVDLILPKFAFYFLQSPFFSRWLNQNKSVSVIPLINKGRFSKAPFILCSLNEQKRIVTKIESIFTEIDAKQEELKKLEVQLQSVPKSIGALKSSILKLAFEGKLVPQDPKDEPAEVLLKSIHKDSDIELKFEKDNLPEGWVRVKLDSLCELVGGGTPSRKNLEYFDGDVLWLTPTEILKDQIATITNSREKITKLGLQKSSAKIIPKNAVLLTSRASIGYVAIAGVDVTTNQGFASFVCKKILHNYFLAYWLFGNKHLLESQATGTIFKEISKTKLRELELDIPPLNEQKRIVTKIESIFGKIDAKQEEMKKLEVQLQSVPKSIGALKSSILRLAFEGKLVPQDPKDEPASVLLERIKSQKI